MYMVLGSFAPPNTPKPIVCKKESTCKYLFLDSNSYCTIFKITFIRFDKSKSLLQPLPPPRL